MHQHASNIEEFNGLVKVLNSSVDFYRDAIQEVDHPAIRTIFAKVSDQHQKSANTLKPFADLSSNDAEDGTNFFVEARKVYTQTLAKINSDKELTFIDQLEEVEDKILEKIQDVGDEALPPAARAALEKVRVDSKITHDHMKALQDAREAANDA